MKRNRFKTTPFWPLMENAITFKDKLQLSKFILFNDRLTNGDKVKQFENEWSKWIGSKHALMVSSGSTANTLLLSAVKEKYKLKNGDKVLVPACTWVTNISPVFQLGLVPIFCDINLENFSFDIEHMTKIKKMHPDIKVIFVTHLLGFSAENEQYAKIFPEAIIIDDVCESHGCRSVDGTKRGSNSLGATFSFYFGHHMTTIEGGMVNTNDSELYELMRMKRSHGLARESGNLKKYSEQFPEIHSQFLFMTDGYNFRSTEINAVLGLQQLPKLDEYIRIRRENFERFVSIIQKHSEHFYEIKYQEGNSNFCFPFLCKDKETNKKIKFLFDQYKIEHRPIVGGNLLKQPFLINYSFSVEKTKYNVDILNDNGVYIGNNQFVNAKRLDLLEKLLSEI